MNLADVVLERASEQPDAVALIFENGDSWSFAALAAHSAELAWRLLSEVSNEGGTPRAGDGRILVYMQNSPELVVALLAVWRAGLTAVPVNIMYTAAELRHAIELTSPLVALTTDAAGDAIYEAGFDGHVLLLDDVGQSEDGVSGSKRPDETVVQGGEDAIVLFTGGSTGPPKAVTQTHEGFAASLVSLARASKGRDGPYPLADAEVPPNIVAFPLFHSGGINSLLFAWTVGRTVLLMERFRASRFVCLVREYEVDNLFLLPTMLYDLLDLPPEEVDLSTVRAVLISGQELNPVLRRSFETKFNIPVLSNYGSTEVGHVAGWTRDDFAAQRWVPGAVGRIYDGIEAEIRDEDGRALPPNETGELWVRSRVTRGYVDGEGTDGSALIEQDWVRTQDVGYVDEERRLYLSGRARDMIKCGGFQVWPSELEEILLRHELVKDVAVVPMPDDRLGEIPVAVVVPDLAGGSEVSTSDLSSDGSAAAELIAYCRQNLAHYKAPRRVEFIERIPRADTGKTAKGELQQLLEMRREQERRL